jgi:hypothetical protein
MKTDQTRHFCFFQKRYFCFLQNYASFHTDRAFDVAAAFYNMKTGKATFVCCLL